MKTTERKQRPNVVKGVRCKIIGGVKVPNVKGRPVNSGPYGEPTQRVRVPVSLLSVVYELLIARELAVQVKKQTNHTTGGFNEVCQRVARVRK